MPGRHASQDRRRLRRDLMRLAVRAVLAAAAVSVLVFAARLLIGGGEQPAPAASEQTSAATAPTAPATAVTAVTAAAPTTTAAAASTTAAAPAAPTTSTAPTLPPAGPPPMREPGQIIVLVLNSTQTAGLAGRVTEQLSELGYRTESPDNHPSPFETSVVWYLEGFEREAEALAEALPDANVEPFTGDAPRAHLTVVLGSSHLE